VEFAGFLIFTGRKLTKILEGRFKIIKKLGSGAFGEIFKGT
jgi:hypothetical protein